VGGSQFTGGRQHPPPANNPRQPNPPRQQPDLRQKINEGRDARSVLDSRRREREVAERDDADCSDRFPAFTARFNNYKYPEGFKPIGITKYDGKQAPQQWLHCYSTAIEVAGGSNTTKVVYFSMALEPAPLTWLESLPNDSIGSWDGLKKIFIDNFQGAISRAGTRHDLAQCKQERNELLRSYTRRFFDVRATIANISEEDIIDCFYNGLTDPGIYRDFGRNRPKTVAGLRDMMHDWSEQEEKMRERFPRRTDLNQKCNNDNRADKGQRDFSGSSRKRKPDNLVAAVERPSRGKKSTTQEQFEKLLQKKCPWCVNSKHTAIDCFQLKRTFGSPGNSKKNKSTGKEPEDEEQEDRSETLKFQDASKTVNVIFGGDEDFCSKREQKLLLREILSVEPAVPRPLRWSEVPISFSCDDQWTSFSEPGKFPLVLDPVVAEVKLTRVFIDGGSGLNLIFASTLKKMGLDLTNKLTPSKAHFYGIVPGNAAHPLGTVVLPVTFGTRENYRTEFIKFEVANFKSSYHAILGRPALAKFMAVPHYVYLFLKMPGRSGVLTLRGDLKKSYDCNQEAIQYASTSRMPDASAEVLAAAQQLSQAELDIPTKKVSQSGVKSTGELPLKTIQLQEGDSSKIAIINAGLGDK
jgi:hypothetical protein